MPGRSHSFTLVAFAVLVLASFVLLSTRTISGRSSDDLAGPIARGAGTTIIHGGTGASGGFVPVITTIAFSAARSSSGVSGSFECLAKAPEAGSALFTMNAMYVTGQITGATVSGDTATLTGTATITGLGAGSNVSFTFVVQKGGPGATSDLTVGTLPAPFHEILLEGSFDVAGN